MKITRAGYRSPRPVTYRESQLNATNLGPPPRYLVSPRSATVPGCFHRAASIFAAQFQRHSDLADQFGRGIRHRPGYQPAGVGSFVYGDRHARGASGRALDRDGILPCWVHSMDDVRACLSCYGFCSRLFCLSSHSFCSSFFVGYIGVSSFRLLHLRCFFLVSIFFLVSYLLFCSLSPFVSFFFWHHFRVAYTLSMIEYCDTLGQLRGRIGRWR